ncbi:MAG: prephenate dehydratase [Ferruginibacter sp.]
MGNTSTGTTKSIIQVIQPQKVAIQGYEGSFHQEAARKFFGNAVEVICCATFRDVVKIAANSKLSTGGVMAIENSIAGSILPNYNLLLKSNLSIVGEIYLQIKQQLMVNPGVKLEDIHEVHSHPMAIQQCFGFLDQYNWKLVESEDTALSAKSVARHRSKHIAAIASKLAAEIYGLQIIAPNIHTLKNNYTRFLIVVPTSQAPTIADANKASIYFHTNHSKGSLAKVLTCIADLGFNLSKLQSFPIPGSDWKYAFHADIEFESLSTFNHMVQKITPLTESLKVYGIYKKGKSY